MKPYTIEFKRAATKLVIDQGMSGSQASKDLGVSPLAIA